MSDLLNKAKDKMNQKLNNDAQPGNKVEGGADGDVNNKLNQAANDVGMNQQDQGFMDKVADTKVNRDIPFGNN